MEMALFSVLAAVMLGGALGVILCRNPILCALSLAFSFLGTAGLFLTLHAEFVALVQVLVYAGAILVIFLFVILLINLRPEHEPPRRAALAIVVSYLLFAPLVILLMRKVATHHPGSDSVPAAFGSTTEIGMRLFTDFLFPFEVLSVLLLAAMLGVVILAKKEDG